MKKQVNLVDNKRGVIKKKKQVTLEPKIGEKLSAWLAKKKACMSCCCSSHCSIVEHDPMFSEIQTSDQQVYYQGMLDKSWLDELMYEESILMEPVYKDFILNMISSINLDLEGAADSVVGDFVEMGFSCYGGGVYQHLVGKAILTYLRYVAVENSDISEYLS